MSLAETVGRLLDDEERWAREPNAVWGLPTGFPSWDQVTHGLHNGEVTIVAARYSSGKTSIGLQVALAVAGRLADAEDDGRIVIVSPEMGETALVTRLASIMSGVPSLTIRSGTAEPPQREAWRAAAGWVAGLDRHIVIPHAGRSVAVGDLVGELEALHHERPLRLAIVDYLQVLTAGGRSAYESATEVSRRLRDLANRLDIPLLVMSQLSRPKDKQSEPPPSIYELRDSGSVEQDADNVLLLYRPISFDAPGGVSRSAIADVTVAKQRQGPLGAFKLYYHADCTRFEDLGQVMIHG